mgnify:FL=1
MPRLYTPFHIGFWGKVSIADGCWVWRGARRGGRLNQYGNYRGMVASRVAWEITRGHIPDGLHVLHRCDIPLCVNPDHLFLGTIKDNAIDMMLKGRKRTKNDWHKIQEIRNLYANHGTSQTELSRKFSVSRASICLIVNNKQWVARDEPYWKPQ